MSGVHVRMVYTYVRTFIYIPSTSHRWRVLVSLLMSSGVERPRNKIKFVLFFLAFRFFFFKTTKKKKKNRNLFFLQNFVLLLSLSLSRNKKKQASKKGEIGEDRLICSKRPKK